MHATKATLAIRAERNKRERTALSPASRLACKLIQVESMPEKRMGRLSAAHTSAPLQTAPREGDRTYVVRQRQ